MDLLGFVAVPAIMVICYLVAEIFKLKANEGSYKAIPAIVMAVGAILGGVTFILLPGYLEVDNLLEGVAIGIVSGLGSTGVHQLIKQLGSDHND